MYQLLFSVYYLSYITWLILSLIKNPPLIFKKRQIDTFQTTISNIAPTLKTQNVFYELKEIIASLRTKKINVYIGVHPLSKKNYEANIDNIRQLKSLINLLNKNNIFLFNKLIIIDDKNLSSIFFDGSHYSPILAQKVISQFYKFLKEREERDITLRRK